MPQQHFVQTHVICLSLLSAIAILGSTAVHMSDYMRSLVAPRPEEFFVIKHLEGGGQLSDSSQVYVRILRYCKLRARLGGPGPRGTCFLGSFYLPASEMLVNGSDSSGSSQMLFHGDAQSFPEQCFSWNP